MADAALAQIEASFTKEYEQAGRPVDMALFSRHESDGRLHCEVMVYLSPAAARVAGESGAKPCVKPTRHSLGLLIGSERCWQTLFPE